MFMFLISKCCLSSSGKPKGKKGGGKDKPKNVKSNTGGEQAPEVCTVYSISFDILPPFNCKKGSLHCFTLGKCSMLVFLILFFPNFQPQKELILHCVTCNNEFPTRNKLFDHLKTTGHASPLPSGAAHSSVSKSKKDKRKNR